MIKRTLLMQHRIWVCCIFLFGLVPVTAQDILWEKSYGGKYAEYLSDVTPTPDYGFILAGSSLSKKSGNKTDDNNGNLDYWIAKMDEKGELDWQKTFGGPGSDMLSKVILTNDGGFLLAGVSNSEKCNIKKDSIRGLDDFWIIKLNAKGVEEWQKTIGGIGQEKLSGIIKDTDGGFVIAGSSASDISGEKDIKCLGSFDYWVVKLDDKGSIVWQKTYGGNHYDELRSIGLTSNGGFILGGYSNSSISGNKTQDSKGDGDYWILKINKTGDIEWQKTIGGNRDDQLSVIEQTHDNGFVVGGYSISESTEDKSNGNQSGTDFWILKIDENGEIVWQETYNFGKVDILTSLVENQDHTILVGGFAQGEILNKLQSKRQISGESSEKMKAGTDDFIALKISEKGEELWSETIGSDGEDILKKAIETRDGGYLLTGTSKGKPSKDRNTSIGSNDFWVVKLLDKNKPKKEKKDIEAIPNPAITYTNVVVGYEFNKGVATLVDISGHILQQFEISERTVPIDLRGYPEGVYIVNIKTDVQSSGVKIIKKRN